MGNNIPVGNLVIINGYYGDLDEYYSKQYEGLNELDTLFNVEIANLFKGDHGNNDMTPALQQEVDKIVAKYKIEDFDEDALKDLMGYHYDYECYPAIDNIKVYSILWELEDIADKYI